MGLWGFVVRCKTGSLSRVQGWSSRHRLGNSLCCFESFQLSQRSQKASRRVAGSGAWCWVGFPCMHSPLSVQIAFLIQQRCNCTSTSGCARLRQNFKSSPKKRHTNWAQRSPPSPSRPQSLEPSLRVPLVCNARHRFCNDMISWTHPKLSKDHSRGSLKFPEILQLSLLGDHIAHTITQVRARRNARDVWHVGSVVLHSPSTPCSPALSLCVFLCFPSLPPSFPLSPLSCFCPCLNFSLTISLSLYLLLFTFA